METRTSERSDLRRSEWLSFLFFTLVVLPAVAVAFVGAYGFAIWMSHVIYGPPVIAF